MTSIAQRAELQAKIWRIANDVRGSVDGWDFKQFVLGTLFYRFISENFTNYIEGGDDSVKYATLLDDVISPEIKDDAIKTKGYFIYPSQLFVNVTKTANTNPNLNTDLKSIFDAIESSANGYPSEPDIKGLFADFDTTSTRLGNTVESKNSRLAAVLKGVEELNFGAFQDNQIDLFGDAYEFLIGNYAANAGKSGGEFFTPQHVSKLIAQLAMHKQTKVNKIYDPAAGSGSLLLQAKKHFDNHIIEEGFYGQEVNHTTYNHTSVKWIPSNCVIIAMSGATAGRSAINKIPLTTNQHCLCLEANQEKVNYRYVFHWVSFNFENIKNMGQGARGDLNSSMIKNFKIPIPSHKEQERIVSILDKFDILTTSISEGLPKEIELRKKQYEYYRDKLLMFNGK